MEDKTSQNSVSINRTAKLKTGTLLKLEVELFSPDFDFNIRKDYALDDLVASIKENGVRTPLKGYVDGTNDCIRLTDGYRRFKAVKQAISEGADIKTIPVILEGNSYTMEKRIFDMFILNDGKPLTATEEAEGFERLIQFGYSVNDISKKIGKTQVYVSNKLSLASVSKEVKDLVADGTVAETSVVALKRGIKDGDKLTEIVKTAVETKKAEGSSKKVTAKDLNLNKDFKRSPVSFLQEIVSKIDVMDSPKKIVFMRLTEILATNPSIEEVIAFLED